MILSGTYGGFLNNWHGYLVLKDVLKGKNPASIAAVAQKKKDSCLINERRIRIRTMNHVIEIRRVRIRRKIHVS